MRAKRAQTATEYLIILAVVIVIALIVVGVMGGIPGVGKSGKSGVDQAYWATSTIGLASVGISAGTPTASSYVLKNNDKDTVTVNSVYFTTSSGAVDSMLPAARTMAAGESATIGNVNTAVLGCVAGQSFSYLVNITYTEQTTGSSYTVTGHTIAGTCAN